METINKLKDRYVRRMKQFYRRQNVERKKQLLFRANKILEKIKKLEGAIN
jgi:hypothetical protein